MMMMIEIENKWIENKTKKMSNRCIANVVWMTFIIDIIKMDKNSFNYKFDWQACVFHKEKRNFFLVIFFLDT